MSLSFLPAVRRFPLFLPAAKLAAAALVAMVVAAPVHAYTAEDCERGYRIYNHPSKGSRGFPFRCGTVRSKAKTPKRLTQAPLSISIPA